MKLLEILYCIMKFLNYIRNIQMHSMKKVLREYIQMKKETKNI